MTDAQCDRCQGNGEIITDWERYLKPLPGDVGDEAVISCPDCDGEGVHDMTRKHPPCRICNDRKWVAIWRDDKPEETICVNCCETGEYEHLNGESGHEFSRGTIIEPASCIHCGVERGFYR